jgi:PAS domain S-box-containing protein
MSGSSFIRFFQAPAFEDETTQRRAQLLSFLINLHLGVAVSVAGLYWTVAFETHLIPLIALASCWPALMLRGLLGRGRVGLAAAGFLGFIAVLMPITALLTGTSAASVTVTAFQFVTMVMAGLLLGGRGTLGFVIVTALLNGGLLYGEARNWYAVDLTHSPILGWLAQLITYSAVAALLWMTNRLIRESWARARQELAERQQAEATRHHYAERLENLLEIDRAILAARSPEEIALAAVARIRRLVPCQRASVNLFDFEKGEAQLLVIHLHGETQLTPGKRATLEDYGLPIIERLRQGEPFIDDDFRAHATASPLDQQLLAEGVRAWLMTPLLDQGELLGALNLGWPAPGPVNANDIAIAREVANQLAIAIRQARLFEAQQVDIARHRQTEGRLRESEARLQLALEAARLGTWTHDFQQDQTIFSKRMQAIYGERVPADSTEFIHPEDQPQVGRTLGNVLQNRRAEFALTYRVLLPDGHLRWIESWGQATYDETGQPQTLAGVARDVTERMQIEEALHASENRFSQIFLSSPAAMLIWSETKGVTDVNEAFLQLVGCTRDEVLGPGLLALNLGIDPASSFSKPLVDGLAHGGVDFAFRRRSGETGYAILSTEMMDLEGEPRSVISLLDITDRKQAEMALQQRTQRLETLSLIGRAILRRKSSADIAREALTHLHQLTPADRASIVLFDVTRQEAQMLAVVGLGEALWPPGTVLDFAALSTVLPWQEEQYSPDIRALAVRSPFMERLLAEGLCCVLTLPLLPDENIMGRIHLTATRPDAFDAEARAMAREVADMLAVALQQARLHEQVQRYASELEQRVTERTAQLQAANEELEAFSYSVSHDLRAPLRGIDGFSRLLLEEYAPPLGAGGQRYLGRIRENAQRMGRLIDDLLQFSRLGRQPIAKQLVNMRALVQDALLELRPEIERRPVELVIADLPAGLADPTLLRQVFVNLLGNALKYTRHRTPARIEVDWHDGAYRVHDNGVGFDMHYVDKLFGVFQRLHRADEFEGTGVGLANVKRIIERHGGRIWAEAAVDQGATFYFSLPSR